MSPWRGWRADWWKAMLQQRCLHQRLYTRIETAATRMELPRSTCCSTSGNMSKWDSTFGIGCVGLPPAVGQNLITYTGLSWLSFQSGLHGSQPAEICSTCFLEGSQSCKPNKRGCNPCHHLQWATATLTKENETSRRYTNKCWQADHHIYWSNWHFRCYSFQRTNGHHLERAAKVCYLYRRPHIWNSPPPSSAERGRERAKDNW